MKLPNANLAIVEEKKIRDYLLNPAHRYGASKADFFMDFGFTWEGWELLAVALKEHALDNDIARMRETGFGPRYEIDAEITAPDGRRPRVRAVWQLEQGRAVPRLITAHPWETET